MKTNTFDDILDRLFNGISKIHSETIHLPEPFIETARRFAHLPGTTALLSGGKLDCARYHILGIEPWMTFSATGRNLTIEQNSDAFTFWADPFDTLQTLLKRFKTAPSYQALPLSAGFLGYLAYDLKDTLEELPRTSVDDLQLPHLYMTAPSVIVIEDRLEKQTRIHLPQLDDHAEAVHQRLESFKKTISFPKEPGKNDSSQGSGFASAFSRQEYITAVDTVREYIASGHVYQVNMSQRFESAFSGCPFSFFAGMYAKNPAPFFAYINAGDHQIVSTSPERFIALNGKKVETRPIKGTRPRGETSREDQRLKSELESSPKDDAELSMIVDLMRNDIGKVCRAGSVHVREHKRLEAYENVYHLVSIINGILEDDKDAVDLIRATFPGGSITGCPKIRAMEIIDELEPVRRHIYTGSIGYISFHDTMDLSIAIRTATIATDKIVFSVGGGIVYDSDPDDEFDETLHKGRTIMNALPETTGAPLKNPCFAWHNGIIKPLGDVAVSVEDEGFLYGYGFFETIRVDRGVPAMLNDHLERFNRAWQYCFSAPLPDITWDEIIRQLIVQNGLSAKTAVVKILASAGNGSGKVFDGTLLVMAKEYTHRLHGSSHSGLHLAVYPHCRHSHLADHKTMNYMFYKMAGQWAADNRADEALILNADRSVSETNTANIFVVSSDEVFCPLSEHVLSGTMETAVRRLLAKWGQPVENKTLLVNDIKKADGIFLTNSLMGAIPVLSIDGEPVNGDNGRLCQKINEKLRK